MLIQKCNIRSPEGDGSAGGGGDTTPPAAPATTQTTAPASTTPAAPSPTQANVWGNRDVPSWMKEAGVADAHKNLTPATAPASTEPAATTPPVDATQPTSTPPPPAQQFDTNALTAAVAAGVSQALPKPAAAAAPQMTDAQLRQQLGIFQASADDYEALLGVKPDSPARVDALNRMLQGVAKQAVTISKILNERALAEQQAQMTPYIQTVRAQEAERQRQVFFTENKDLVGYEVLSEKIFNEALASGRKFTDVAEARRYVAEQTRQTLKSIGVTPGARTGTGTTTNGTPPPPATRQMTTTSVGGRSGGSATQSKPANMNEAVWGRAR